MVEDEIEDSSVDDATALGGCILAVSPPSLRMKLQRVKGTKGLN